MSHEPFVLILLGLSGSGKGTQAELLIKKFGFEYIVMGDLLRQEVKKQTELGRKINEIINIKGQLVPDEITTSIFKEELLKKFKSRVSSPSRGGRLILDGYPRTKKQAESLGEAFIELKIKNFLALDIKISEAEAVKRLSGRLICLRCKTIHFPKKDVICRKCGGKLVKREDDTPQKVKARLAWGKKEVDEVIEHYRKQGKLLEINGEGGVGEIHKEIIKKLNKYLA